jgi:hypothetical protein
MISLSTELPDLPLLFVKCRLVSFDNLTVLLYVCVYNEKHVYLGHYTKNISLSIPLLFQQRRRQLELHVFRTSQLPIGPVLFVFSPIRRTAFGLRNVGADLNGYL